jgi:hypothetical protein
VTRRFLFKCLAGLPLLGLAMGQGYGHMTIDRWCSDGHLGKRVLVDGSDITGRCTEFDDHEGWAMVFSDDPPRLGLCGTPMKHRVYGRIEVV